MLEVGVEVEDVDLEPSARECVASESNIVSTGRSKTPPISRSTVRGINHIGIAVDRKVDRGSVRRTSPLTGTKIPRRSGFQEIKDGVCRANDSPICAPVVLTGNTWMDLKEVRKRRSLERDFM